MSSVQPTDVRFEHVIKHYGRAVAVRDLSLDIPRGMFFSLLGPSGCGKTTTLRLIAGFEQPSEGEIYIRDSRVTHVPPHRRDFAMVFQNFALFPHLTVAQNVGFGLRMIGTGRAERDQQVRQALDLVKLDKFADRYPKQMSGGQQQRVAIARALVGEPKLILADEPTGNLDTENGAAVMDMLKEVNRAGTTVVMVTHSLVHAAMAARTVKLLDGQVVSETLLAA
jgi:ABC-type Fe3+/spermidine/putrescine transport system ATPase subunit